MLKINSVFTYVLKKFKRRFPEVMDTLRQTVLVYRK